MICLSVYFIIFMLATALFRKWTNILYLMIASNVCNDVIILTALILYSYTIVILRSAIAKCASFQFETTGTYVIAGLYCFTLMVQLAFLICYEVSDFSIII